MSVQRTTYPGIDRGLAIAMLLGMLSVSLYARPVRTSGAAARTSSTIRLNRLQDLSFGVALNNTTPGTIVVEPNGTVRYNGGVLRNMRPPASAPHPAILTLTLFNPVHRTEVDHAPSDEDEQLRKEADDMRSNDDRLQFTRHGYLVNVVLPPSSNVQLAGNPGVQMLVDRFTMQRTDGTCSIGATLHIDALQPPGNYAGTFTVTMVCE